MKNVLTFALTILALTGSPAAQNSWFVSPAGSDQNPGTKSRPFATLARAVEASRTPPAPSPGSPRTIFIEQGEYYGTSVKLDARDSGLTIAAAPGAAASLMGGAILQGFQRDGEKFWAADLPAGASADFRMLVVDGRFAPRARFPESGRLKHLTDWKEPWMGTYGGGWRRKPTHEELSTMKVKPQDLGAFESADAELTIYHEWDESMLGVQSYDPATGELKFSSESGHPPGAFGNHDFVVWNTRTGMTRPGQWYVDRLRKRVVYWPMPGEKPAELRAIFPTTQSVLTIEGTAERPVRNLTLTGLTFAIANTPLKSGGFGAYAFAGVITGHHLESCRLTGLTVKHAAGQGIKLSRASQCEISSCKIAELGAGGITADGNRLTVARNQIHHIGLLYPSAIGLSCNGEDDSISLNSIHATPYVGLTCGGYHAVIESNRLESVMQELHDGAGIYLGGTNHLIRGNVCVNIGSSLSDRRHAYYMDEHVRDSRLENNIASGCPSPLHNHMATNNTIINNLFVNDGDVRLSFFRCSGHRLERNLISAGGRVEVYRPEAVEAWSNNLFFSRAGTLRGYPVEHYSPGTPVELKCEGIVTGQDPQLQISGDAAITWDKESAAAKLGIQPLDLRRSGSPLSGTMR